MKQPPKKDDEPKSGKKLYDFIIEWRLGKNLRRLISRDKSRALFSTGYSLPAGQTVCSKDSRYGRYALPGSASGQADPGEHHVRIGLQRARD
jgi:hypothetical protein